MSVVLTFLVNTIFNLIVGLIVAKFLGPAEYGKFALAILVMGFGQVLAFEWIRLCAIRFYSERTRSEAPKIRATLDAAFLACASAFLPAAMALAFFGPQFALPRELIALALAASIANGLFDFHTALVRARFDDRLYVRLIVSKNLLALVLTAGGAWATGSATVALIAGMSSLLGALFIWRPRLGDCDARLQNAESALVRPFALYAAPIVAAVVLYQMIPLANRDLVARWYGFAETGKFALAYDLGLRAIQAIGSALDVLLFQIAVRAHDAHGEDHARAQVAQNMAVVFAVLAPACVGLWIVLPSVEVLVVPEAFRGPFAAFLGLMLPGLFCYGMTQFAIHPIFQIARRTGPLVLAALVACLANAGLLVALPHGQDASTLAVAQSAALGIGMMALIGFAQATGAKWPRLRDLALSLLGCAAMVALCWPLRGFKPGLPLMLTQIALGGGVYALIAALFDIAGLRSTLVETLAPVLTRLARKGGIFKLLLPLRLG